ncbi:MAG: pyridoxamine 5'-phosphate oxidase family protein [Rubrivivax sp.]|nr:pyridoxamine 5'-phosphate oxidase family protein [Rubrivivax sp.]
MNARLESLHIIESACWREIERAVREREHAWRVMTLATVAGDRADARSVVLREARSASRQLIFYTDDRSPKVAQMHKHPLGTLLLWSPALGWQLRLQVRLEVLADGLEVSSRWARMKLSPAAQDYLSPLAPGTPLGQPGNERGARDYFAVVAAHVLAMDWLELHADGHRRVLFDSHGARWVQP